MLAFAHLFFPYYKIYGLQLPKGRDVEEDDSFVFNEGFTAPLYRIKVSVSYLSTVKIAFFFFYLHEHG